MGIAVKIVLPVVIAIAAVWGYLTYAHPASDGYQPEPQAMQQSQTPDSAAPAQDDAGSQISARGTSDASLDADLNAIDTDMQGASQSSDSVDASMNDQAGDTSY